MASFEDSVRHHNSLTEFTNWINLAQNQMMIYQNQRMLEAQNQTNALLFGNELARQKEKQIDLWIEEFRFRGKSPLEAQNQAVYEWKILEARNLLNEYTQERTYLISNALNIVIDELKTKKFGEIRKRFSTLSEKSDEVYMFKFSVDQGYKNKVALLSNELEKIPKSEIEDDSSIRTTVAVESSRDSLLEVYLEAIDKYDAIYEEFNLLETHYVRNIVNDIKIQKKLSNSTAELKERYSKLKVKFEYLNISLGKIYEGLNKLIEEEIIVEVFENEVIRPFTELKRDLTEIESNLER